MVIKRLIVLMPLIAILACDIQLIPDWASKSNLLFNIEGGPKAAIDKNCRQKMNLDLQNLKWKEAKEINIFSRKSGITPKNILLNFNTPNIIKFYNGTNFSWTFYAEKFFKEAVVVKIIYRGKDVTISCIEAIRIGKLKWAEIHIVPLKKGKFNFRHEKPFSLKSLIQNDTIPASGQITVH